MMEGAIRNLVSKKVLTCMSGAFSDKWFDVAKKCGKQAEALQVEWGSADPRRRRGREAGHGRSSTRSRSSITRRAPAR
ncbi:MAG: hypothetical protein WDO13_10445 [Verrucomicrobiota bacterium]